jgi:hypothetical protein
MIYGYLYKGAVVMKNLWMFLSALTFVTQAYCMNTDEFEVVNNSHQPLCIQFDNKPDASLVIKPGDKKLFKTSLLLQDNFDLSPAEQESINLSIGLLEGPSQTFKIKYPPAGKTITITETFREHFFRGAHS